MPSLDGVHAKLARSEKHLKLAVRLIKWFARNKCTIERQPNPETNRIDAIARLPAPPAAIGLILGDAIHNMRSALDHMVWQLILSNPDPDKPADVPNHMTMFPICDSEEGFRSQVRKGRLRGVGEDPLAVITRIQPYNSPKLGRDYRKHYLWLLDRLENIDKHRRMTITSGVAIHSAARVTHAGTVTDIDSG